MGVSQHESRCRSHRCCAGRVTAHRAGKVWIVDLGMAAKVRPAVVLSIPPSDTERALVTLVPHTTSLRASRLEVETQVAFLKPGGFDAQGLVTIPFARLVRPVGQLKPHELAAVECAVCSWLGIPRPERTGAG